MTRDTRLSQVQQQMDLLECIALLDMGEGEDRGPEVALDHSEADELDALCAGDGEQEQDRH